MSAEVGGDGRVGSVTLKDAAGQAVAGGLREDGSSWVPSKTRKTGERYAATVVATGLAGDSKTVTILFTTMGAPAHKTGTGLYLFDGHPYGVAIPVVVEFSPGVKKGDRAAVPKRLFVGSSLSQSSVWSWTPPRSAGLRDQGRQREQEDDRGAGSPGGARGGGESRQTEHAVVERDHGGDGQGGVDDFDTTDIDGAAGYRDTIQFAQRLTWSGQYIRSALWSTGAPGHTNVSHG